MTRSNPSAVPRRAAPVTVAELLHLDVLTEPELVAGEAGASARVSSVRHAERLADAVDVRAGTALVLGGEAVSGGWAVEMALRRAWERAAACVITPAGWRVVESTRRLADRLNVPLLMAQYGDAAACAVALTTLVMQPAATRTQIIATVARNLAASPRNPRALVGVLNRHLPSTDAALLAPDRTVLSGRGVIVDRIAELPLIHGRHQTAAGPVVVQPVHGPDQRVVLYIVAALPRRAGAWLDTVTDALAIAAAPVGSWVAIERLTAERDARLRSALLAELLARADTLGEQTAEQVAKLGWRLDGWHIGIHLVLVSPAEQQTLLARTPTLTSDLADAGIRGPVVERADGWSAWVDYDEEPSPRTVDRIVGQLRKVLAKRPADLLLAAGVGQLGVGISGLRSSLSTAREAATLAVTAGPGTVEHSGDLGLRRLLAAPLGSDGFCALAGRLLDPLVGGEDDALLDTLTAYLDSGCSSSEAASRLRVHRNTVARRVERAVDLLGISLDTPEERLALHLACHAVRGGPQAPLPGS
ncbi:MAG: hypothetical protein GEV03_00555 [Streptosporangiales bacterium]|nr:hypothetical protein [Streptosporangiales bacterium]